VFGPVLPFHPELPYGSALAVRGYYFGFGGTVETRLRVDRGPLSLVLDARGHAAHSVDGVDRHERSGLEDPHGVTDQRLFAGAHLGLCLGPGPVWLRVAAEGALRRGAWRDQSRATRDGSVGLEIAAEL
jgi:hypothetical protein